MKVYEAAVIVFLLCFLYMAFLLWLAERKPRKKEISLEDLPIKEEGEEETVIYDD